MLKQWFKIFFSIVKKSVLIKEMGWIFIFQGLCIFGPLNPGVWLRVRMVYSTYAAICFLHKLHNFPCIFLKVAFLVSKMWFRICMIYLPLRLCMYRKMIIKSDAQMLKPTQNWKTNLFAEEKEYRLILKGTKPVLWQNWWNSFQTQLITSVQLF